MSAPEPPCAPRAADPNAVVAAARAWIGSPYSRDWGETGAREALIEGAALTMISVPIAQARPGDMLVFRMERGAIAKHVGILTAPDRFVHAYERIGVIEEPLAQSWQRRIAGAFRMPCAPVPTGTPPTMKE